MKEIHYFGTKVSCVSIQKQMEQISGFIYGIGSKYVLFADDFTIVKAKKHRELQQSINVADLVLPEGMPLIRVARMKGFSSIERCKGAETMQRVIEDGLHKGYKHYFYTTKPKKLQLFLKLLKEKYPNIQIVGSRANPTNKIYPAEEEGVIKDINTLSPDCIWIGLTSPRQEIWMRHFITKVNRGVMFGIGSVFNKHIKEMKKDKATTEAPSWMERLNLEWIYSFIKEPARMWDRYVLTKCLLIWYVIRYQVQEKEVVKRK